MKGGSCLGLESKKNDKEEPARLTKILHVDNDRPKTELSISTCSMLTLMVVYIIVPTYVLSLIKRNHSCVIGTGLHYSVT